MNPSGPQTREEEFIPRWNALFQLKIRGSFKQAICDV
jgi:hypothetical protein